jgi:hypothetical protein
MTENPEPTQQSQHINLKWHIIKQIIQLKMVSTIPCCNADQTADILIKAIPQPKHKKHTGEMGLVPV